MVDAQLPKNAAPYIILHAELEAESVIPVHFRVKDIRPTKKKKKNKNI
jgi:hypothetical protein